LCDVFHCAERHGIDLQSKRTVIRFTREIFVATSIMRD
jgi:hypothetical protein